MRAAKTRCNGDGTIAFSPDELLQNSCKGLCWTSLPACLARRSRHKGFRSLYSLPRTCTRDSLDKAQKRCPFINKAGRKTFLVGQGGEMPRHATIADSEMQFGQRSTPSSSRSDKTDPQVGAYQQTLMSERHSMTFLGNAAASTPQNDLSASIGSSSEGTISAVSSQGVTAGFMSTGGPSMKKTCQGYPTGGSAHITCKETWKISNRSDKVRKRCHSCAKKHHRVQTLLGKTKQGEPKRERLGEKSCQGYSIDEANVFQCDVTWSVKTAAHGQRKRCVSCAKKHVRFQKKTE